MRLVCLLFAAAACMAQETEEPSIRVSRGWATVTGIVRENVKHCDVDGPCYLRLGQKVSVMVVYHPGEGERLCSNGKTFETGDRMKPGDRLEAAGTYTRHGSTHEVLVCCPKCVLKLAPTRPAAR